MNKWMGGYMDGEGIGMIKDRLGDGRKSYRKSGLGFYRGSAAFVLCLDLGLS